MKILKHGSVILAFAFALFSNVAHCASSFLTDDWLAFGGLPFGCNGKVLSVASLPNNELIIGGEFLSCGNTLANNVAIRTADGQWKALTDSITGLNGTNGSVKALLPRLNSANGSLESIFIGGTFIEAGGVSALRVVQYKNGRFISLGTAPNNGVSGILSGLIPSVSELAFANLEQTKLYVSGVFANVSGASTECVALFDEPSGLWTATGQANISTKFGASALTMLGTTAFMSTGDSGQIIRYSGAQGTEIAPASFVVDIFNDMVAVENQIYVSGSIHLGGQIFGLARIVDPFATPISLVGVAEVEPGAHRLAAMGNTLGILNATTCNGPSNGFCTYQNGTFSSPIPGGAGGLTLGVHNGKWVIGGQFDKLGGVEADSIALFQTATGVTQLITPKANGILGKVFAMAVSPDLSTLYVGGSFTRAGTVRANNIAKWNGQAWSAVGTGVENGVSNSVTALAATNTTVYVGGGFINAGTTIANGFASFDTAWRSYGNGFLVPGGIASVSGINIAGNICATSNQFVTMPVRCWVQSAPNQFNWIAPAPLNGVVNAILPNSFTIAGILPGLGNAARLGTTPEPNPIPTWFSLLEMDQVGGVNGQVFALANNSSLNLPLIVGGDFTQTLAGIAAKNVAVYGPGTHWSGIGTQGIDGVVRAITYREDDICIGGEFQSVVGTAPYVACRNGGVWKSLGSGTDGPVYSILTVPFSDSFVSPLEGKLFVAGAFELAGNKLSIGIAAFGPGVLFKDGFENQ